MFVAYTGYGRVATLGEEVRSPSVIIPRAIILTLVVSLLLYLGVAVVAIGSVGAEAFAEITLETSAPLETIAAGFGIPGAAQILAIGAVTAMLGVLLNLLLGLSRVLLAMGRRGDMPPLVAKVNKTNRTPEVAIVVMGVVIALLVVDRRHSHDVDVQRVHRIDLLCDHESGCATASGREAALSALRSRSSGCWRAASWRSGCRRR